jgi:hypothetical protein
MVSEGAQHGVGDHLATVDRGGNPALSESEELA